MALLPASAPPLDPEPAPELILSRFTTPEDACKGLGFNPSGEQEFPFQLEKISSLHARANSFASGSLEFEGRRFGFLRIGSLDEQNFQSACRREWRAYRQTLSGTCGSDCRINFHFLVARRLLREIAARIRQLDQAGSQVLVVDVTGNPGGSGWYRWAAQLFSAKYLSPLRIGYVKNWRTVEFFEDDRRRIVSYLLRGKPGPELRAQLEEALCRLDDLLAEAEKPCDASSFWSGRARQAGCTRLTTRPLYTSGLLDRYDGPPLPVDVQYRVFFDGIYGSARSAWRGPVLILVDQDTGSFAELFAGSLQRLAGAVVIGRPTSASGGGWNLGRQAWVLPRSKMQFYLPDTVAYWPDGENARSGLVPDVPIRWRRNEDPVTMGKQLLEALRSVDFSGTAVH
jgi:hypothetical protein